MIRLKKKKKAILKLDFFFQIRIQSVTITYPQLLPLQKPTNEVKFVKCSFRCFLKLLDIVFDSNHTHPCERLESSSLQKVSNSIREGTCTLGVQRSNRDDGEGRGGWEWKEDDLEEGLHQGLSSAWPNQCLSPTQLPGQRCS